MKPRYLTYSIIIALVLGTYGCKVDADQKTRITLLMTHPRAREIKNIVTLKKSGLISVPSLHLIGLIHEEEWENYKDARRYLRKNKPDWIELKKVTCKLDENKVYQDNHCSVVYRQLFETSMGILFTGGPDIPPSLYGEKTSLITHLRNTPRQLFEVSFLYHLLGSNRKSKHKPYLSDRPAYVIVGICMGMQLINVALGGNLVQDIPSEIYGVKTHEDGMRLDFEKVHRSYTARLFPSPKIGKMSIHSIRLNEASTPKGLPILKKPYPKVISLHHQAVDKLGVNLKVFATSADGKIVEGLRHNVFPGVIGVQFHPEKRELLTPWLKVRKSKQISQNDNFVSAWYLNDKTSQHFHKSFWNLFGRLLIESKERHPEKPKLFVETP